MAPPSYTRLEPFFWSHTSKDPHPQGCWLWTGRKNQWGYGEFRVYHFEGPKDKWLKAHRASWLIHHGPIPLNLHVLHACDNRACVNPVHLFLGTHLDNMRDMALKGRSAKDDRNNSRTHPERRPRGSNHYATSLTEEIVVTIRKMYVEGTTQRALAAQFSVGQNTIYRIVHRETWKHVP